MIKTKQLALTFSAVVLLSVIWPVHQNWKDDPKDDFPLSYYPMFSHKRKATHSMPYFVGYDATGERHLVPFKYVGTGGFNQVRRQINRKARNGNVQELTEKVAQRLARCKTAPLNTLVRVEMVRGKYHLENYFLTDGKSPIEEKVYHSENIERK